MRHASCIAASLSHQCDLYHALFTRSTHCAKEVATRNQVTGQGHGKRNISVNTERDMALANPAIEDGSMPPRWIALELMHAASSHSNFRRVLIGSLRASLLLWRRELLTRLTPTCPLGPRLLQVRLPGHLLLCA